MRSLCLALLLASPAAAADVSTAPWRAQALRDARTWMMQLSELDAPGALEALARSDYPLVVIEPGDDLEPPYATAEMIERLKTAPSGRRRLVLAYADAAEAQDFRSYWKPYWKAPTENFRGYPDFLLRVDSELDGSYPVAVWSPQWRERWLGPGGRAARLARLGFDGVVLDGAENYETPAVAAAAAAEGLSSSKAMIGFIAGIRASARAVSPDFLVLVQNAIYLVDEDTAAYVRAVDGLVAEETFFHGQEGSSWDDSSAGDLRLHYDEEGWSTEDRLAQYEKFSQAGLPVFSVDYCVKPDNAALVYAEAAKAGLRPLVTRYPLSRLTPTPPPAPSSAGRANRPAR